MQLISPSDWKEYELIDSGNFEKLERFGEYILARPEPQACWKPSLSKQQWDGQAHVRFVRERSGSDKDAERGKWEFLKKMPDQWYISYRYGSMNIKMRLGLTSFKHVGIFPEQAENWNYIYDLLRSAKTDKARVLNLFAYTGGASLAAKAAGADVTHVDSVKPVVSWARENMEASGLSDIRWVVEDAVKFVRREVKRGNRYNGIILDPPAYGRGPEGEKWILEDGISALLDDCAQLLAQESAFVILNLYSMGYSSLVAENLFRCHFPQLADPEAGELFFADRAGNKLPLGIYCRANCK
jgi:23S rRNA (cytosine1962-C5)-methyltransferase